MQHSPKPIPPVPRWVTTREDALTEAYWTYHWMKDGEAYALRIMANLLRNIDKTAGDYYRE